MNDSSTNICCCRLFFFSSQIGLAHLVMWLASCWGDKGGGRGGGPPRPVGDRRTTPSRYTTFFYQSHPPLLRKLVFPSIWSYFSLWLRFCEAKISTLNASASSVESNFPLKFRQPINCKEILVFSDQSPFFLSDTIIVNKIIIVLFIRSSLIIVFCYSNLFTVYYLYHLSF